MHKLINALVGSAICLSLIGCGGGSDFSNVLNGGGTGGGGTGGGGGSNTGGSTQNVTLNWVAPVARVDGSSIAMSEIGGYKIYYGASIDNTPNTIKINNKVTQQYVLSLTSGTYFFKISSYDVDGVEGPKSAAISRTL